MTTRSDIPTIPMRCTGCGDLYYSCGAHAERCRGFGACAVCKHSRDSKHHMEHCRQGEPWFPDDEGEAA